MSGEYPNDSTYMLQLFPSKAIQFDIMLTFSLNLIWHNIIIAI
jgi:hypothetical protein